MLTATGKHGAGPDRGWFARFRTLVGSLVGMYETFMLAICLAIIGFGLVWFLLEWQFAIWVTSVRITVRRKRRAIWR